VLRWGKIPGFGTTARNDVRVGTLTTLSLPPDSPVADLPWVITVGALDDDEGWEPVVFGPYERGHALALAQAVVADEDLMAVVEPLLPLIDAEAIREEIETVRGAVTGAELTTADDEDDWEGEHIEPGPVPSESEVRAGFARLAARLTAG